MVSGGHREGAEVTTELDDLKADNARLRAQLAVFTQPTEWDMPGLEWTWGSSATDGGPGQIIHWTCSEQMARDVVASEPGNGWPRVLLCRDVSAWREVEEKHEP
jgi:hypothetical protein